MKKLYRSKTNRKIAGICGGLAAYTNIDATIWRIGFVIFALLAPGILAYGIMWLVIPEEA